MLLLHFVIQTLLALSLADYQLNKSGRTDLRGIKDGTAKAMLTRGLHEQNRTYFNREENLIRVPHKIEKIESIFRHKTIKSPKRTIQKIIRKGKDKVRRTYAVKIESTAPPRIIEISQEEFTTEKTYHRKNKVQKSPKTSPKVVRNKLFHFQTHKRNKRDTRELYILKDFDEMEFVKNKKDYDEVNAHVKKYW
ncbi:uncharacterized protein LOC121737789 [Aricia agestis]|uniref:uncharacterized protein LOC121737789 n=1 Tax=Aricia agestis TaxID=91739 RepID=UPI001C208E90|nr:uncharacterized protein LOC121737789 [Aricia agestis]